MGKLGLPPLALNSGSPLGLPSVLYSAPPSASVALPLLLPVDNPHSNNSGILFFDPPNKILLDHLAIDLGIIASSSVGEVTMKKSLFGLLTSMEEMLDVLNTPLGRMAMVVQVFGGVQPQQTLLPPCSIHPTEHLPSQSVY
jgi:hypothetical protein